jgi:translin
VSRPDELAAIGDHARESLDAKHHAREITFAASRRAVRSCANAIRAVHRGEYATAEAMITEARMAIAEADAVLDGHADIRHAGFFNDAQKEFAEANLTLAFVRGEPLVGPAELEVDVRPYLGGLAEAASELRRDILDCLRRDEIERAEELLGAMDDVYGLLVTIDYAEALTGGLRRATDALRAVLERTRGDVTSALVAERVRRAVGESDREKSGT